MSSLSYLGDYSSGSDSSDHEIEIKRVKLPGPNLSKVPVVLAKVHVDEPELHGGRTRSFPHVRGNWATFVYVNYSAEEELSKLLDTLEEKLIINNKLWQRCDNIHISVSKTFVLNYHLIAAFTKSLQEAVSHKECIELGFSGLTVYCNEEKSRTFIALQVDNYSQRQLHKLSRGVDEILEDFKLPVFYEDPSFHMSLFWINGNYKTEAIEIIEKLNEIVYADIENSLKTVLIDKVLCKSGNKHFQYYLQ